MAFLQPTDSDLHHLYCILCAGCKSGIEPTPREKGLHTGMKTGLWGSLGALKAAYHNPPNLSYPAAMILEATFPTCHSYRMKEDFLTYKKAEKLPFILLSH